MKTKIITTYSFSELSESAQERALAWHFRTYDNQDWHEYIYDDAKTIGLKITSFETERSIKGHLTEEMFDVVAKILKEHGKDCDTYKFAEKWDEQLRLYLEETLDDDYPDRIDNFASEYTEEFEKALLEEYLSILNKEWDYINSRENIEEHFKCNEYEFTKEGEPA